MSAAMQAWDAAKKAEESVKQQIADLKSKIDASSEFVQKSKSVVGALEAQKEIYQRLVNKITARSEKNKIKNLKILDKYKEQSSKSIEELKSQADLAELKLKKFIEESQLEDRIGYGFGLTTSAAIFGSMCVGGIPVGDAITYTGSLLSTTVDFGRAFYKPLTPIYNFCYKMKYNICGGSEPSSILQSNSAENSKLNNSSSATPPKVNDKENSKEDSKISELSLHSKVESQKVDTEQSNINIVDDSTIHEKEKADKEKGSQSEQLITKRINRTLTNVSQRRALKKEMLAKVENSQSQLNQTISETVDFVEHSKQITDDLEKQKKEMVSFILELRNKAKIENERDFKTYKEFKKKTAEERLALRNRIAMATAQLEQYIQEQQLKSKISIRFGVGVGCTVLTSGCIVAATTGAFTYLPVISAAACAGSLSKTAGRIFYDSIHNCWNWVSCSKNDATPVVATQTITVAAIKSSPSNTTKSNKPDFDVKREEDVKNTPPLSSASPQNKMAAPTTIMTSPSIKYSSPKSPQSEATDTLIDIPSELAAPAAGGITSTPPLNSSSKGTPPSSSTPAIVLPPVGETVAITVAPESPVPTVNSPVNLASAFASTSSAINRPATPPVATSTSAANPGLAVATTTGQNLIFSDVRPKSSGSRNSQPARSNVQRIKRATGNSATIAGAAKIKSKNASTIGKKTRLPNS